MARHTGIKAGIRFAHETDSVVWNNDDDAIIMRMHVAEAVINHPLGQTHPATDGTLQQLGARQLVEQLHRFLYLCLRFVVFDLARGMRQAPQFVDGVHCGPSRRLDLTVGLVGGRL